MQQGDRLSGHRFSYARTDMDSKYHMAERAGRWYLCYCGARIMLNIRLGRRHNHLMGEIRIKKMLGRYRKRDVPVYES